MDCKRAKQLFNEHIDNALDNNASEAVENHLMKCARCRGEFEGLLTINAAAKSAFRFMAPNGFAVRVMEKIRSEEVEKSSREKPGFLEFLWTMPAQLKLAEAAIGAIVIAAGLYFGGFISDELFYANNTSASEEAKQDLFASVQSEHFDITTSESINEVYFSVTEGSNGR